MKKTLFVLLACGAMSVISCSPPKMDTSSDEKMKASLSKIKDSLDTKQKGKFEDAMGVLIMAGAGDAISSASKGGLAGLANLDPEKMKNEALKKLDGKTADEIIAMGEKIVAEQKARERNQALAEIKELTEKKVKSQEAAKEIAKFQIIKSRFYIDQSGMFKQPVIALALKNGTSQAISRAFCKGVISSPGRSVPWHQDNFNFTISGGLEPGEEQSLKLSPNMFSGWGKVDAPADAVFTVTCDRLNGAGDKEIYNAQFSDEEAKRLVALTGKFPS